MAGSKGSKYYNVFLNYKFWLYNKDKEVVQDDLFRLLIAVKEEESLSKAAKMLGISYRKAWNDIKNAENTLGVSFVKRQRGGKKGGKSYLTTDGEEALTAYYELVGEFDKAIHDVTRKFFRKINN